jgi:hypothetical protein
MAIDHHRLVQIAGELKNLDHRRESLLGELRRIAGGGGVVTAAPRGRPPRSGVASGVAPTSSKPHPRKKRGLTRAIIDLLESSGAAYTAGDIVAELKLAKSKSKLASVSTTLVRLAKEGRVKKDEERGYLVG